MIEWLQHAVFPSWIVVASVLGLGVGVLLGRLDRPRMLAKIARLDEELARSVSQAREQARQATRLHNEQRAMSKFMRVIPQTAQDLNSAELKDREIPKLVFDLVDAIFEPEQSLLYLVRSAESEPERGQVLHLVDRRGKGEVSPALSKIRLGEGKIGWVGESKVVMLADDWLNMTRLEGRTIENNHPSLRPDLLGPLIYHQPGKDLLLGVLCVSGPAIRPRDERLMLLTVTNLASIAYANVRNLGALQDLANYDGLTRLLNKREFMSKKLGEAIYAAGQAGQPLSVFVFDIDHFKTYNDTNGHLAGDEILRGVAQVVRDNIRPVDLACRYGGEEFIVAMPGTRGVDGIAAAERIREAIERYPFPRCQTQPKGRLTISGGVAQFPVDGTHGTVLIGHADQALYQAKKAGRNRIVQYRGVDIGGSVDDEPQALPHADTMDER